MASQHCSDVYLKIFSSVSSKNITTNIYFLFFTLCLEPFAWGLLFDFGLGFTGFFPPADVCQRHHHGD